MMIEVPFEVIMYFLRHNILIEVMTHLLAPPAERQRSFSNTDLSVVRLSVKIEGGGVYLRNASVTFLLFWHGASLG